MEFKKHLFFFINGNAFHVSSVFLTGSVIDAQFVIDTTSFWNFNWNLEIMNNQPIGQTKIVNTFNYVEKWKINTHTKMLKWKKKKNYEFIEKEITYKINRCNIYVPIISMCYKFDRIVFVFYFNALLTGNVAWRLFITANFYVLCYQKFWN